MEIHDKHLSDSQRKIDLTQSVREGVRKFTAEFEPRRLEQAPAPERGADRIELSEQARTLAARDTEARTVEAERRERIEELRAAHRDGKLNTPERVERAAERLLGAE
jgi:hypothetical protein